jgi:hypothetical protein
MTVGIPWYTKRKISQIKVAFSDQVQRDFGRNQLTQIWYQNNLCTFIYLFKSNGDQRNGFFLEILLVDLLSFP